MADIEAVHTFEGTETMQALILGSRHHRRVSAFCDAPVAGEWVDVVLGHRLPGADADVLADAGGASPRARAATPAGAVQPLRSPDTDQRGGVRQAEGDRH